MSSTTLRRPLTAAFATVLVLSGTALGVTSASAATPTKACKATMSVASPRQYTTTVVRISGVGAKAAVTTAAHYKTTTNTKKTTATATGTATTSYNVSGATPGRKVPVTVTAVLGKTTWSCSTSYTPHR